MFPAHNSCAPIGRFQQILHIAQIRRRSIALSLGCYPGAEATGQNNYISELDGGYVMIFGLSGG